MSFKKLIDQLSSEVLKYISNTYPRIFLSAYVSASGDVHVNEQCPGIVSSAYNITTYSAPYADNLFGEDPCEICVKGTDYARFDIAWWSQRLDLEDSANAVWSMYTLQRTKDQLLPDLSAPEATAFNALYDSLRAVVDSRIRNTEKMSEISFTPDSTQLAVCFVDLVGSRKAENTIFCVLKGTPVYKKGSKGLYIVPLAAAQFTWDAHVSALRERILTTNRDYGVQYELPVLPYYALTNMPTEAVWETMFALHVADGISLEDAYTTAMAF